MSDSVPATIQVRIKAETKDALHRLADAISRELGTKVSMSQAVAVAINEALAKRGTKCDHK